MTAMDPMTLEELMKEYGQDVWSFAYSITKNRATADDIAQDVFLQAYRHLVSFRGESSVRTWLLRIARNISLNYRNSAFFRRVLLPGKLAPSRQDRSAEEAYFEREAASDVWRHVFSLPVKMREALVLHAKYQLSLQEIARILDVPEGTVKSRLFGARKRMSTLLKEEWSYEPI
ncbi:sigma-70 family RNA polymerase sigma factor [Cohnella fermenti]|uniref:RNA polymerase sigma factor n=2 Tax=Cohnella fermenti TaxID=2565925 RepID=A0A4S4C3N5_9BACL|nr:sigma-70 family RNA polymerase sigma factor [Cohnella fermenti]